MALATIKRSWNQTDVVAGFSLGEYSVRYVQQMSSSFTEGV